MTASLPGTDEFVINHQIMRERYVRQWWEVLEMYSQAENGRGEEFDVLARAPALLGARRIGELSVPVGHFLCNGASENPLLPLPTRAPGVYRGLNGAEAAAISLLPVAGEQGLTLANRQDVYEYCIVHISWDRDVHRHIWFLGRDALHLERAINISFRQPGKGFGVTLDVYGDACKPVNLNNEIVLSMLMGQYQDRPALTDRLFTLPPGEKGDGVVVRPH